jgi:hypothetical protein
MKSMKRLLFIGQATATAIALLTTFGAPAHAQKCMTAGGWGTGAFEGFASFMAQAAMKNSAKGKLGDAVKIGPVSQKCAQKGLLVECTARARACR